MTTTVGVYEAKTHFTKLLALVEQGEDVIITRHGKEIATLVPRRRTLTAAEAADAIRKHAEGRVWVDDITIKEAIEEGRM